MSEQASASKDYLHDLIEAETMHLDVVASWESLCDTYDAMRFSDPMTDVGRMEEYKWIIQEMNKFLSKMRSAMMRCSTTEAVVELLRQSQFPTGKVALDKRQQMAYQKLRQRWVMMELDLFTELLAQEKQAAEETEEEETDVW